MRVRVRFRVRVRVSRNSYASQARSPPLDLIESAKSFKNLQEGHRGSEISFELPLTKRR